MKMTVLEMVQDILSALESDDVNSISDTPEGLMVARIIRNTYYQMLTWASIPELKTAFFPLEGLSDTTKPTFLQLPDDVEELYWFQYDAREVDDTQSKYRHLVYNTPEVFFGLVHRRDLDEAEVVSINSADGVPIYIYNDRAPEMYTILNDKTIVTDAYDSAVEATLQGSKSVAGGLKRPTFTLEDSFTPEIDDNLFPFLLSEAKAVAFTEINQISNNKQERIAREQKIRHQNQRHRFREQNVTNLNDDSPDYGRPIPNFGRRTR